MSWVTKNLSKAILAVLTVIAGYLSSFAAVFCILLNINRGFCEEPAIKYGLALVAGAVIGVALAERGRVVLLAASLLIVAPWIVLALADASNWEFWVFKVLLLAPMQLGVGLVLGVGFAFLWKKLEPLMLRYANAVLRKKR
jgi:hypothetical protein